MTIWSSSDYRTSNVGSLSLRVMSRVEFSTGMAICFRAVSTLPASPTLVDFMTLRSLLRSRAVKMISSLRFRRLKLLRSFPFTLLLSFMFSLYFIICDSHEAHAAHGARKRTSRAQRISGINLIIYTLMGDENDKPTCKKS